MLRHRCLNVLLSLLAAGEALRTSTLGGGRLLFEGPPGEEIIVECGTATWVILLQHPAATLPVLVPPTVTLPPNQTTPEFGVNTANLVAE